MIDFQGLLNVLHAAEQHPNLNMQAWRCGTSHCMIGAFCAYNPHDILQLEEAHGDLSPIIDNLLPEQSIAQRFGITEKEVRYLFIDNPLHYCPYRNVPSERSATLLSKEQALARLRKFIYYKLHKQEISTEVARTIPGRSSALLAANA